MNDIRAPLTSTTPVAEGDAVACAAEVAARTGRRPDRARAVTAGVTGDSDGTPAGRACPVPLRERP